MLDDHTDKSAARQQIIAIVLMTVLVFFWFQFFMPLTPPVEEAPPPAETEEPEVAERDRPEPPLDPVEEVVSEAWPELPPVADPRDPEEDAVVIENEDLRLVFTRIGGRLREAHLKLRHHGESEVQLVPQPIADNEFVPDSEVVFPLGLTFTDEDLGDALDRRRFDASLSDDGRAVVFSLEIPETALVEKRFALEETQPVVHTSVSYRNLSDQEVRLGRDFTPAYKLTWAPDIAAPEDGQMGVRKSVIWRQDGQNTSNRADRLNRQPTQATDIDWVALRTAYFVVGMKPTFDAPTAFAQSLGNEKLRFGVAAPRMTLAPNEADTREFQVYIGPSHRGMMAAAWETLPTVQRFFESFDLMDRFAKLLLGLLNWFYGIIPNYGVAIILLTILVRGGMFPLTFKSMKSMKRMQSLAPEMQALKEKYGEDQQELNKKMMELYRERGANPFGSCLPLLLQMPIFIALYRMLWSAYELRGAPFTLLRFGDYHWISDLSQPDRLIHLPFMADVPLLGQMFEYLNILPLLGALAILASQKLMPTSPVQNDQQKLIMNIMPIFMAFLFYRMAAGLNLYILVSTVLGILQNKLVHLSPEEAAAPPKKSPKKKRNFYAAAQEKKRRMAKESKSAKKRLPG